MNSRDIILAFQKVKAKQLDNNAQYTDPAYTRRVHVLHRNREVETTVSPACMRVGDEGLPKAVYWMTESVVRGATARVSCVNSKGHMCPPLSARVNLARIITARARSALGYTFAANIAIQSQDPVVFQRYLRFFPS